MIWLLPRIWTAIRKVFSYLGSRLRRTSA